MVANAFDVAVLGCWENVMFVSDAHEGLILQNHER
jgi:hypothetical protein